MSRLREWVSANEPLALSRQCLLAGVARSSAYARLRPVIEAEEDHLLLRETELNIRDIY